MLVVTVVEGEVAAEVAEDVEAVAEEVAVAEDVDGASRSKDNSQDAKDTMTQLYRIKSRGTIEASACRIRHHQSMRKWLARDPERKRDRMILDRVVIAQMV